MLMFLSAKIGAVSLLLLSTLGAASPEGPPEAPRNRRKLEAIEMSAAGDAGVIRTVPEYLGEPAGAFHFGPPHCRGRSLGQATLEQLHAALRTGQLVTIAATDARAAEGTAVRCVQTVTFWAPGA